MAAPSNLSKNLARSAKRLRDKAPIIAGLVAVGGAGVLIGRVTASSPPPAPAPTASVAERSEPEPQVFDLTENPNVKVGIALRPMDRDIFAEILSYKVERTRMKDVFPDKPYRVAFVGSMAEKHVGAVLVDINRDGKWDERWEMRKGDVDRLVMEDPNAGNKPVKYTLSHGRWQVH